MNGDVGLHGLDMNHINALVNSYTVQTGSAQINAGDFVRFVDDCKSSEQVYKPIANPLSAASTETTSVGTFPHAVLLDSAHALLVYLNTSGYGTAVVITFTGLTPALGTPLVFASAASSRLRACLVDVNKVVVALRYPYGTGAGGYVVALLVTGTTITAGSLQVIFGTASGGCTGVAIDLIDTNKAMAHFQYGTSYTTSYIITVTGTTCTLTTTSATYSIGGEYISSCSIGTNKFLVAGSCFGGSLKAVVINVSGSTISIGSVFTSSTFAVSSYTNNPSACIGVSTDKALVVTTDSSFVLKAIVLSVSGATISEGAAASIKNEAANPIYPAMVLSSAGHGMLIWSAINQAAIRGCVLVVTGTTIYVGAIKTIKSGATSDGVCCCLLASGQAIVQHNVSSAKLQIVDENTIAAGGIAKSTATAGNTIRVFA